MAVAWIYILTILMPVHFLIAKRAIDERKKNKKILLAIWQRLRR